MRLSALISSSLSDAINLEETFPVDWSSISNFYFLMRLAEAVRDLEGFHDRPPF
jgi:hypothetical protein